MDDTITPEPRPAWIAGAAEQGAENLVVTHPFDGTEVATVAVPGTDQVERAMSAAADVTHELSQAPSHHRADALQQVSRGLAARAEELAEVITAESGKPLYWAHVEVARTITVFRTAAERARAFSGELQRLDSDPDGENRVALVRRVPRGPVLAIAPCDFPLNLVAHKVAPALAVGAPTVVKPSPRTPLSALILGEILAETNLPSGTFSVLPTGDEAASILVRDPRLPVVSFTGSGPVGWSIADSAARKHTVLELGGNAAAVVLDDWSDLDGAARRIATFGTYQAGQSRIAVQRVIVQRAIAEEFIGKLTDAMRSLPTGDPYDPNVRVGPVVDEDAAQRVESWINAAVDAGATLLTGGTREGATVEPTLLRDVTHDSDVWAREVFGPVVAVAVVETVDDALAEVNNSEFGIQASVFTRDVQVAFRASAELDVGCVIIGDVPSYLGDAMPYGGVQGSGAGREGVPAAMDDLTQERVTVFSDVSL